MCLHVPSTGIACMSAPHQALHMGAVGDQTQSTEPSLFDKYLRCPAVYQAPSLLQRIMEIRVTVLMSSSSPAPFLLLSSLFGRGGIQIVIKPVTCAWKIRFSFDKRPSGYLQTLLDNVRTDQEPTPTFPCQMDIRGEMFSM